MTPRVFAVVLAGGASRRLGRPKQLLPFRGTTLLRTVAAQACSASCAGVAVVLGAAASAVAPSLDGLPLSIELNPDWEEGIASSIRCAIRWVMAAKGDAALLLVGDQPNVTAAHLEQLLAGYRTSGGLVGSRYAGVVGVPAVLPRDAFPALLALRGEQGARQVLRSAPALTAIDWPQGTLDIDTPADAALLLQGSARAVHL